MSQQPESGPPVLKLYAIELPDGSIAMNGPYVLATEDEGQAGRMAHARDGQEIAFVRLSKQEFKNDPLPPHEAAARELQQAQVVNVRGLLSSIIQDICETEPSDPERPDSVVITVQELENILADRLGVIIDG